MSPMVFYERLPVFAFAFSIACGGGKTAGQSVREPIAPVAPKPANPPRRTDRIRMELWALSPEGSITQIERGLDARGRFRCRAHYLIAPPLDKALCQADGYALETTVLHLWDGRLPVSFLVGEPTVDEISDCGNRERRVKNPSITLLHRIAPWLRATQPIAKLEANAEVTSELCRSHRFVVEVPLQTGHRLDGTVHHFANTERSGSVTLRFDGHPVGEWPLGPSSIPSSCGNEGPVQVERGVALEMLCTEAFAVITGSSWRRPEKSCKPFSKGVIGARPSLVCDPATEASGYVLEGFTRKRLGLEDGSVQILEPPALAFDTAVPADR